MGRQQEIDKDKGTMADHHQNEHKHGTMDIKAHEQTFEGFVRMSIWVVCVSIGILVLAALLNA
jgi:Bacterial aa3 type cytochrome c oxidase subunit IV